jgi:hypothetical protein
MWNEVVPPTIQFFLRSLAEIVLAFVDFLRLSNIEGRYFA